MNHCQKIFVRYTIEMLGCFVLYGLFLYISNRMEPSLPAGPMRTLVVASPLVPFLLTVWVVVRQFRRMDEYGRLMSLQSIAIAFGVTMAWVFTYGFLEGDGFPRLSMLSVWSVGMGTWGMVALIRGLAWR